MWQGLSAHSIWIAFLCKRPAPDAFSPPEPPMPTTDADRRPSQRLFARCVPCDWGSFPGGSMVSLALHRPRLLRCRGGDSRREKGGGRKSFSSQLLLSQPPSSRTPLLPLSLTHTPTSLPHTHEHASNGNIHRSRASSTPLSPSPAAGKTFLKTATPQKKHDARHQERARGRAHPRVAQGRRGARGPGADQGRHQR